MNGKTNSKPAYYSSIADRLPEPFIKINVMETRAGYTLDFHAHEYYHVNHIYDGCLQVECLGKRYIVSAGQTVIMPPVQPHRLTSETGYRQIGIDILECRDERGLSRLLCDTVAGRLIITGKHITATGYDKIRGLLDSPTHPNRLRTLNFAEGILLDALDELGGSDPRRDKFVLRFNEMLNGNRTWRLTLADMCERLGMSRSQLERTSRRVFGCGASEYYARLRFREICSLLKTTDLTLDGIADQTGFYDAGHLSVFFFKRAGITPGQYRSSGSQNIKIRGRTT